MDVFFVDGVRTAFGRAGPKGVFWRTRADDMAVKVVREVLRRNPQLPPERIGDVVFAATAQVGDQGLTMGRDVALLAGIPQTVPGFAVDRMCAGALTAVTAGAGEIGFGAADVVLAGGVEHMGHHPMGEDVDFNPRFVAERLVDTSAVTMGATAENLHDRFPQLTKEDADALRRPLAAARRRRVAERRHARDGRPDVRLHRRRLEAWPTATSSSDRTRRWRASPTCRRRSARAAASPPATRPGSPTARPPASSPPRRAVEELGLEPKMRLVGFAYAGVEPELMGLGPVPATKRRARAHRPDASTTSASSS